METTDGATIETPVGSAPAPTETATETVQAPPQTPDLDRALEVLEKNWESIPQEKREKLDRHFQPAFNRRVNWLNESVAAAVKSTGIEIPDGKTPLDLLTEDNGKGFAEYIGKVMESKISPVTQKLAGAEFNQNVNTAKALAIADMPEIAAHLDEAVAIIETTPDLLRLATSDNGKGFYRAFQGVGAVLAMRKMQATTEAAKIAERTAAGTTQAGQGAPKETKQTKLSGSFNDKIKQAAQIALERMKAEQA